MQVDQPRPTHLSDLEDGEQGTRETLSKMVKLVRLYRQPMTRAWQAAHDLVRDLPQKAFSAEVNALFVFVRDHIRYVHDTHGIETVQTADATLDIGQGDCDDKSVLLATLLQSIGYAVRFVAVGRIPNTYQHVFVQVLRGSQWVSLDATEPVPVGWTPSRLQAVMIAHV